MIVINIKIASSSNGRSNVNACALIDRTRMLLLNIKSQRTACLHVPRRHSLGQHKHVVAVPMHRVDGGRVIIDDEADDTVGACVVDIPFGGVGVEGVPCSG